MNKKVRRIFVNKKAGFDVAAKALLKDLVENLGIKALEDLSILNRYDVSGIDDSEYEEAKKIIFSEKTVDDVYDEAFMLESEDKVFAVEYLPGQYDQRADSACQCIKILTGNEEVLINSAKVIILKGNISDTDFNKIKKYVINPVDSREASLDKAETLEVTYDLPYEVEIIEGFTNMSDTELEKFLKTNGLAMSMEDLKFCQGYFKNEEERNPTITEIKVIDTYWSDHCRHTTFQTRLNNIKFEDGKYSDILKDAYKNYVDARKYVYEDREKEVCLMDIAVIGMKELKKKGFLNDLDESEEINACSIVVDADVNGKDEKWLVMFKNETHNHPTEIEPFGGAATCLGGAIRDPLSGRSYVYQAMRVTGSGDPRTKIEDTTKGRLPQKKITLEAAHGYSSYGNQIGLATGQVSECYDEGFIAKRMEVGAVVGAAPKENVVREIPEPSDVVILLGGRTGRDGCGGATGSSKEHDVNSLQNCGAEVQKGNAPTERKLQRLFRNKEVSTLIKRCNDFGAGGVSVAIGELTEGLDINLDLVPKKYEGLDGTELAISESQERMAVVVRKKDAEKFMEYADKENLEAVIVANVTDTKRLKLFWKGNAIVNVSRAFLDTNGVRQNVDVFVKAPKEKENYFKGKENKKVTREAVLSELRDLNVCSQKGLSERFDSTIGAGTVLMPFGGKYQITPAEGMAAKLPVLEGDTTTGTVMTYGYNPKIGKWSPFHGAMYAVIESLTKLVCMGGDYRKARLTFQEYFERLNKEPEKWGKPFAALLGALKAQEVFKTPAIGGKDSMSGTFMDLNVPPTLVSFAVNVVNINNVISPEFKKVGSKLVLLKCERDENEVPIFDKLKRNFDITVELIKSKNVLSAQSIRHGGLIEAISKMCFGNKIGFEMVGEESLFEPDYGSILLEIPEALDLKEIFKDIDYKVVGSTIEEDKIILKDFSIELKDALEAYTEPLEKIFPTKAETESKINLSLYDEIKAKEVERKSPLIKVARPRVFIPVFPGTNCEYDSSRAFERAGAEVSTFVFRNMKTSDIEDSINKMVKEINKSQIIMLPGGFSAGDEPDGSGKFIAAVLRNEKIKESVAKLLNTRDGLMLGICNGFQALIKLGLVPYGEIKEITKECPTLTYNNIGRHVSQIAYTKIVSNKSPWLSNVKNGDIHSIPISHGEGRFAASREVVENLIKNDQIATRYVDLNGNSSYETEVNPNGSVLCIEGITSPDGRILGKMGHSERFSRGTYKNIVGNQDQKIFESGVQYFK
ncbi:phosphoribosylformylglycinamidine synthase [Clostridium felsineum]|uniref:Phosphoribosylformylglycinamidine synthase n=1 Tax=Clostridium felsineum TaxID=36839 RepID=A0A1S8M9P7_9CLOT|nr:phosphoribosylformylglycinamidine synthase [Clostridium felsineum]URZ06851.1 Phosphoribosylformylglycinamidine synthase [Clostridium felsineum]URZ11883.1 Phosphoribosylformylglycinamidine synthase [Clostridium felsineum]